MTDGQFPMKSNGLYAPHRARAFLSALKDYTCGCKFCVSMCENRPCWGTPEQAGRIIDAGHADKMMLDFWVGENGEANVELVAPAMIGREGQRAKWGDLRGRCAMLTVDGKCMLHDAGLKPVEGVKATCKGQEASGMECHRAVASLWDTDAGRAMVDRWWKAVVEKSKGKAAAR